MVNLRRWSIYVFNSVVNTKLPFVLSHRCSTTVSLETYPFLFIFFNWFVWVPPKDFRRTDIKTPRSVSFLKSCWHRNWRHVHSRCLRSIAESKFHKQALSGQLLPIKSAFQSKSIVVSSNFCLKEVFASGISMKRPQPRQLTLITAENLGSTV